MTLGVYVHHAYELEKVCPLSRECFFLSLIFMAGKPMAVMGVMEAVEGASIPLLP
jgi:hypothetical protein